MKKVLLAVVTIVFASCNPTPSDSTTTTDSTSVTTKDTINVLDTTFVDTIKVDA